MDMSRIPLKEIVKGVPKFKWTPPESHYETVLSPGKSTYEEELKKPVKVQARQLFIDITTNGRREKGETWDVDLARAMHLENMNLVEIIDEPNAV